MKKHCWFVWCVRAIKFLFWILVDPIFFILIRIRSTFLQVALDKCSTTRKQTVGTTKTALHERCVWCLLIDATNIESNTGGGNVTERGLVNQDVYSELFYLCTPTLVWPISAIKDVSDVCWLMLPILGVTRGGGWRNILWCLLIDATYIGSHMDRGGVMWRNMVWGITLLTL